MNHQFTPGPWTAGKSRTGYSIVSSNYHRGAVAKANYGMDDARLIAAAPELLTVCEQLVEFKDLWLIPEDVPPEHQGEAEAMHCLFSKLKAAISKAIAE